VLRELESPELAWHCDDSWVPQSSSEEVAPAAGIVGQERAVGAIAFGLAMRGVGYNVFVTGLSGTGRLTTISRFLDQLAAARPAPDDVCFVESFRSPEEPRVLLLEAGAGRRLKQGLDLMVEELVEHLPGILGDPAVRRRVERALTEARRRERKLVEAFEAEVGRQRFALVQAEGEEGTPPEILPVVGEGPVALEELAGLVDKGELDAAAARRLEEQHERLLARLEELSLRINERRLEAQRRVEAQRRETIRPLLDLVVDRVRREVRDDRVEGYLIALREELEAQLGLFAPETGGAGEGDRFQSFRANLVVDNGGRTGLPVVLETEPSATNLFGTVERTLTAVGEGSTSFLRIRAGSLLKANGGFLVLNADDLLADGAVWSQLKRALKYRRVQIQPPETQVLGAAGLRPEPVPLDVKVVVLGDRGTYDWLYRFDSDFAEVFKTLADFDSVMPATADTAAAILSVLRKVSDDERLLAMERSAMAAMLEQAVALGRFRRRFTSRFSDLADLLREASFVAERAGAVRITRDHVEAAAAARRTRHCLSEERTLELIAEGVIHVATTGGAVGQVNGLTVYDLGHYRFGRPARITARVGLGRDGVINVERQSGLSGPTHDKGVQILTGLLRGAFAQCSPLTMSCSITFEQSYGGIDGDSASSTEVYAILSALSGLPLRQDVAVTGSVDQYGRIQAIGGVNQKVEGFFRVCRAHGLTGSQGVLIPASNAADLQLEREVVEAVAAGSFHVWTADTAAEGIELLTGTPAGTWSEAGGWSPGSVHDLCQKRLDEMNRLLRQAGKEGEPGNQSNGAAAAAAQS
jgi:lon-related putative ATP-dependent protease